MRNWGVELALANRLAQLILFAGSRKSSSSRSASNASDGCSYRTSDESAAYHPGSATHCPASECTATRS